MDPVAGDVASKCYATLSSGFVYHGTLLKLRISTAIWLSVPRDSRAAEPLVTGIQLENMSGPVCRVGRKDMVGMAAVSLHGMQNVPRLGILSGSSTRSIQPMKMA
jgi:hypothetical protein